MNFEIYDQRISQIAHRAKEIVPVPYRKLLLYAEVVPGVVTYYHYFYDAETLEWVQVGELPQKYGVERNRAVESECVDSIMLLNQEWDATHDERWTTMTLIIEDDGCSNVTFNIKFGYEDLEKTNELQRKKEWKKKFLGI